jgi:hypothetical protein
MGPPFQLTMNGYFRKEGASEPLSGYPVRNTLGLLLLLASFCLISSYSGVVRSGIELVYPGRRFTGYAVLGDDIVITDTLVAKRYEECLQELKVEISRQKSMISDSGAFEFAKRFRVKGGTVDFSQVSIRTLSSFISPFGLMMIHQKYSIRRF